jgi:rhodanese-related sulfurtransferase
MKLLFWVLTMLLILSVLGGGEAWSASPPPPGASRSLDPMISLADQAFDHAEYAKAAEILRQAVAGAPKSAEFWQRYNRAVLARAGDAYLLAVPKNRYRIDIPCFAYDLQQGGKEYFLLDVREPEEFAKGHPDGAVNIPFRQVLSHLDRLPKPPTGKIVLLISAKQYLANHLVVTLRELGYTNVYTLRDGYTGYTSWLKQLRDGKVKTRSCAREAGSQAGTTGNGPAEALPAEAVAMVTEADRSFTANRFARARELLQQALITAPGSEALWAKYDRAVVAEAGNEYITGMPAARYRIGVDTFGPEYEKGAGLGNYFLLDLRDPEEFVQGHIAGSINIPFRTVLRHGDLLPKPDSGKILLLICRSQHRANHVLVVLRELGYTNAFTLQEGYSAYRTWQKRVSPSGKGDQEKKEEQEPVEQDFGC